MAAAMSEADDLTARVRAINACWLEGRYQELTSYFHEGMILALPDSEQRVAGRDAIIDSYRQFGESATGIEFHSHEPQVDAIGDTAVATTSFEISYELEGARYRESGTDVLVLHRAGEAAWEVVWRTVLMKSSG